MHAYMQPKAAVRTHDCLPAVPGMGSSVLVALANSNVMALYAEPVDYYADYAPYAGHWGTSSSSC